MALPVAPEPKNILGRHRLLSPTAGVRVSPLCLGAMNFGNTWAAGLGECNQEQSEAILDLFYESGGNFIDTANNYQDGESEMWIGEWMKKRGNRDELVLATKYTSNFQPGIAENKKLMSNFGGNGSKSLHCSIQASLEKLQTNYIDLLYVHWWDYTTSIPEMMQSLNHLVVAGKVLYLGVSDAPAWVVSKANEYARNHGLRQFTVYQGRWSAANREFEREIIPMCRAEGMALAPWGALGGGNFKTAAQRASGEGRKWMPATEAQIKISEVLESIAKKYDTVITSVALAYVMHKEPYVFPIVGGRKVDHIKGNIEALKLRLTKEDMDTIEKAVPFDFSFPSNMLYASSNMTYQLPENPLEVTIATMAGHFDHVDLPKPILPPETTQ